jgi:hypothetical protein
VGGIILRILWRVFLRTTKPAKLNGESRSVRRPGRWQLISPDKAISSRSLSIQKGNRVKATIDLCEAFVRKVKELDEFYFILVLYNLRLLATTEILLKAMAKAARMGCSCRSMMGRVSKG